MNRRDFVKTSTIGAVAATALTACTAEQNEKLKSTQILHTVMFNLKHGKESAEAKRFLSDAQIILPKIPGVQKFQIFSQFNKMCKFSYQISMIFDSQKNYDEYLNYPTHVEFVKTNFAIEVAEFEEADFVAI